MLGASAGYRSSIGRWGSTSTIAVPCQRQIPAWRNQALWPIPFGIHVLILEAFANGNSRLPTPIKPGASRVTIFHAVLSRPSGHGGFHAPLRGAGTSAVGMSRRPSKCSMPLSVMARSPVSRCSELETGASSGSVAPSARCTFRTAMCERRQQRFGNTSQAGRAREAPGKLKTDRSLWYEGPGRDPRFLWLGAAGGSSVGPHDDPSPHRGDRAGSEMGAAADREAERTGGGRPPIGGRLRRANLTGSPPFSCLGLRARRATMMVSYDPNCQRPQEMRCQARSRVEFANRRIPARARR
ncbi:hypothetical protein LUPAC07_05822 [Micromonospora noduli]|nr:hypothetical protein LUPAC07_05822 [Micromonospora noduli]